MEKEDWSELVNNIKDGDCILVLGPDIATDKVGEEHIPLRQILSNQFAKEIEKDRKVIYPDDLAYTADLYAKKKTDDRLRTKTESFYRERKVEINNIYKNLAALPFQLVINATPDKNLIQALEKEEKNFKVAWYNYNGEKIEMVNWHKGEMPLIYYLFGSIDEKESLVISEKHLFDFLVSVIKNERPIQRNISSELREEKRSFLFLGFGFRNWYLRILLYVLLSDSKGQPQKKAQQSFALEQILEQANLNLPQVCFLFREHLPVDFAEINVEDFVSQLRTKYEESVKDSPQGSSNEVMDEGAPSVFICHASEDKEIAMDVNNKLRAGGLNPWIDKEGIRSGNDWDRILVRKIKKADYFVVLQSKNLIAKKRGYVNVEINHALERQKEILDPSLSFIYPVKIDDCELLEELDVRQTIDLTNPNNYEKLIRDIKSDYQSSKK